MNVLINFMGKEPFHSVYIYQIITLSTFSILQFCELHLNKKQGK